MLLPKNSHAQRSGVIRYDTRLKLDKRKTVDGGPWTANSGAVSAAICYPLDRLVLGSREEYVLR